jgi:hypothetical protein
VQPREQHRRQPGDWMGLEGIGDSGWAWMPDDVARGDATCRKLGGVNGKSWQPATRNHTIPGRGRDGSAGPNAGKAREKRTGFVPTP